MHKTNKTMKLCEKLVEYLKERGRWTTSGHFVENFHEIKTRDVAREILRRCKDIKEIKDPRDKRRYFYGLSGWPDPTERSADIHG